ncbi:class I SAM-dependent methyltransferase [Halocatena marina]|uniref:Class I SAM-dependent methyltransferase n=2 Tax=Halocatena marina TaxID=2934937 RepID=A0ABD5YP89_9EURY
MNYAVPQYLEAKRTVDTRAFSARVRDRLLAELPEKPRILEAGCGTGTMVSRLHKWGVEAGTYRGVDRSESVLAYAREQREAELNAEPIDGGFRVADLNVRFEQGDALSVFKGEDADLLIAASFLDLVPIREAFDAFNDALKSDGLIYAPLTFDGGTIFQPDHPADREIERVYHDHIDSLPGRDVRAGRRVLDHLRERSGRLLSVAPSDWIIRPRAGAYPANERAFLATILEFVAEAVGDHPDADDWLHIRRQQLEDGVLSYVAHQYDFLYRTAES